MARMLRTLSLLLCLFLLVAPVSPADAAPTDAAVGDEVVVAAYVLDRAPADGEQADLGLAREAAYNLSLVYVATGATPLAHELYARWLSL